MIAEKNNLEIILYLFTCVDIFILCIPKGLANYAYMKVLALCFALIVNIRSMRHIPIQAGMHPI